MSSVFAPYLACLPGLSRRFRWSFALAAVVGVPSLHALTTQAAPTTQATHTTQATGTQPEVIAGTISKGTGGPLAGAVVTVTMAPDRVTFTDTASASGEYTIRSPNGTGDYLVYIAAPGYTAFRKRVTRGTTEAVFRINATLTATVTPIAAMKISARKAVPQRTSNGPVETGASESMPDALVGALAPELGGDLNALDALVPGVTLTPGGFSKLSLNSAQNTTTINGMNFAAGALPRDMRSYTRLTTSTFDPARGWFSGSKVNVDLIIGALFSVKRAHALFDAPVLQSGNGTTGAEGQQFTNVRLSYGADGPVNWDHKFSYNLGVQADRRTSSTASLANVHPDQTPPSAPTVSTPTLLDALAHAYIPGGSEYAFRYRRFRQRVAGGPH